MKIYVDGEMPKSCNGCPFQDYETNTCCGDNGISCAWKDERRAKNCPLQSLAEHDKEARKQVVEEIKSKVKELIDSKDFKLCNHEYANGFCYGLQYELAKILDQVERSEKDVKD